MFKKKIFLSLMLVLLLGLTACNKDNASVETGTDETPAVGGNEGVNTSANEHSNIKIKPEEAFDIYMEKYPNTKVKKVQIDQDKGKHVYKVEGFEDNKEYEIKIDPISGTIIKEDIDTDDDIDDMEITRENVEKVSAIVDKAMLEAGENAELEEWAIDIENGRAILEVEINKKGFDNQELTYDVETGELLKTDN